MFQILYKEFSSSKLQRRTDVLIGAFAKRMKGLASVYFFRLHSFSFSTAGQDEIVNLRTRAAGARRWAIQGLPSDTRPDTLRRTGRPLSWSEISSFSASYCHASLRYAGPGEKKLYLIQDLYYLGDIVGHCSKKGFHVSWRVKQL
jgi:hypothetical protein